MPTARVAAFETAMLYKFRFRLIAALLFVPLAAAGIFADTIRLRDGSRIKGRIVKFAGGTFTVVVGDGARRREVTLTADEVESIQFETEPRPAAGELSRLGDQPNSPAVIKTDSRPPVQPAVTRTETASNNQPAASAPKSPASNVSARPSSGSANPIELNVRVLADNTANGWTNSGWVVKKGQRIRVTGTGSVSLGRGKTATPSGLYDYEDAEKLLRNVPTGALIAVIGDDNNDFIYIGSDREFVATRDGALFLGLNEGNLNDNSGNFDVKVEILPAGGGE